MPTRFVVPLAVVLSCTFLGRPVSAQDDPGVGQGIPITDADVVDACGTCHAPDDAGRLTRISERRDTPEGWERTIRRMVALNGLSIQPDTARRVVKALSNTLGLAPGEALPGAFEVERRMVDYRYEADREVEQTCTACHSLGRVINQRRTRAEWELVIAMHRGYYPLVDSQVFRRPLPVNTPASLARPAADEDDERHPVDRVVDHLASAFPLRTPEWSAWSATTRRPRLAGTWVLSGHQAGIGAVYGRVTLAPSADAADEFSTTINYVQARDGQRVTREGRVIVYTGFQWRGRSTVSKDEPAWREVMFVDRDASTVSGRWFTGEHDETGIDVTLRRDVGLPAIAGLSPAAIRPSATSQAVRIHGTNLDGGLSADDLDFGPGISVARLEQADADGITAWLDVTATAPIGARDLTLGSVVHATALVVYDTVGSIRVVPETGMARVGGVAFPKQYQQFEAVGYLDGPDGESGTSDDVAIGSVDVSWSLEEYAATFEDDDVEFVGAIDRRGLFTPAIDGPNPERRDPNGSNVRNNVGDVWVVATYTDPGSSVARLRARAHLLVTVPLYMQWEPRRTP